MSLLVLEGLDGSGKSTQQHKLLQYFELHNIKHKCLHFPRTENEMFGQLIARFLRGDLGKINEVDPYLVALIYAGDRFDATGILKKWLDEGYVVILDRYVYSNIAYQCAKLPDKAEKEKLLNWILALEFESFKIPRPTINIFLDVPFSFTQKKLVAGRKGDDRDYLKGKQDIHEADLHFQQQVRDMYLYMAKKGDVTLVDCCNGDEMLPPDDIFSKNLELLKTKNIIK
jgi:dTMP kinase